MTTTSSIPGYTYGTDAVAHSPISMEELELLKQTVLFSEEDEKALRMAGEVLQDQLEEILDLWYSFVGSHPHLVQYFSTPNKQPIEKYLAAVRQRFRQWILDTCNRPYDQAWLDYQQEIGLRHTYAKKNQTDQVSSVPHIGMRYMIAFIYPITATIKSFLARKGHSAEEVEKMHQAWFKAVVLQDALWCYPYAKEGYF
ncbi:MAG: hypothetical protein K6T90_07445 [Leptolyngbyaceae cyanobacterium HOT.MB2.61]|nr:hypothetical protein [Leptolyngbyaceae cyanobacterium HOT.MB2.61]